METPHVPQAPMGKIRALLAKADRSDFPEEAEAFRAKALEMIAQAGIEEALVRSSGSTETTQPESTEIRLDAPYAALKSVLVNEIAQNCGCAAVRLSHPQRVAVFGFPADLKRTELLYTHLLAQMSSDLVAKRPSTGNASRTQAWSRSYITGFINEIGRRLKAANREAQTQQDAPESGASSGSVALALVARDKDVDAALRHRFPRLRQTHVSTGGSAAGAIAGRDSGQRADLGGNGLRRQKALT